MALGVSTFSNIGAGVSDIFSADALRTRAQGRRIEAQQYDIARDLSRRNEEFTRNSNIIKQTQLDRSIYKTIGGQQADVAASGFGNSGSALDLMRESAQQGALTKAVTSQQSEIEAMGYEDQAKSYELMSSASRMAADADEHAATGALWSSGIHFATAAATLFLPGSGGASGGSSGGGITQANPSGSFAPEDI